MMPTGRSYLSAPSWQALKAACRRLVEQVGGVEAAAACCRVSHAAIGRYYSPHHPDMMPIDVLAELEIAAGSAPVTAALAHIAGHTLIQITAHPGQPELLKQLAALMRKVGQACMTGADAMDDDVLTPAECAVLSAELNSVVSAASSLQAWLAKVAAEGLPEDVS